VFVCQGIAQLSPLPNKTSEIWHDKIPIAGEIRTGVMADNSYDGKVKESFFVHIPNHEDRKFLHVEICSNDGRYSYTSHYSIEGQKEGIIELLLKTNLIDELKTYRCSELTILSWISENINDPKKEFVLSNWDRNIRYSEVFIYLNSQNNALLFIENSKSGESKTVPCHPIEKQANVAYNCICEMSISDISKDNSITIVQRVRRSQNRYPIEIRL